MFISSVLASGDNYYYDESNRCANIKYTITDSDFVEDAWGKSYGGNIGPGSSFSGGVSAVAGCAIIYCYQRKKLNVAFNFLRFLRYSSKFQYFVDINSEISYHRRYNEAFKDIEDDLKRYLLLI